MSNTSSVRWVGPFRLRDLLEHCLDDNQAWPPEGNGVYVVAERPWQGAPKDKDANVLYVGGNTGKSPRFLARVGDLIADMLGFWPHSSGGQSIYNHCKEKGVHPLGLYLGWVENVPCCRCGEREVYQVLGPSLGKIMPPRCPTHSPPLLACF